MIQRRSHMTDSMNSANSCAKVLHQDFQFIAASPPRQEDPLICAPRLIRGHGGVALGWHRRVNHLISSTPFISSHRAIGIELSSSLGPIYIVSVYLPTRTNSTDTFHESLDHLAAALLLLPPSAYLIIMGDFNADSGHLGGPLATTSINSQGRILHQFMERFNITSSHLHKSNLLFSHTFESDAHSTVSTIDHILCPRHSQPAIQSAHPIDNLPLNTSDHLPVFARLAVHLPLPTSSSTTSRPIQNHPHIPGTGREPRRK